MGYARDTLLGIVSILEVGHTYKCQRIQGKCTYPCKTPNALRRIAVCSTQDALLRIVSICEAGHTYTG